MEGKSIRVKQFFTRPIIATVIKIIVSAGLLVGIFFYVDVHSIVSSFQNADILFLSIGISLAAIQLVIHYYRWRYLLRLIFEAISDREVFTSLFVGFMAGFFTPAQLGEVAGRIASHPTVSKSHVIGITIVDKLYWAALTLVIGGAGISIFIAEYFTDWWNPMYRYIVTGLLGMIIAIFLYPDTVKELLKLLPEKIRHHRFYSMISMFENVFHNKQAWILFAWTSLLYSILLLEYYFLMNAFAPVEFGDVLMCASSVFFVKAVILPISFGDLGVRESAAIYFFGIAGTGAAVAFNASIIMSFANVIIPTIIGAVLVTTLRKK